MTFFSDKFILTYKPENLYLDQIPIGTKNILWNIIHDCFDEKDQYGLSVFRKDDFIDFVNFNIFKLDKSHFYTSTESKIKKLFYESDYIKTYYFIQIMLNKNLWNDSNYRENFIKYLNLIFEKEFLGYRVVNEQIVPITNEAEINELNTLNNNLKENNIFSEANKFFNNALKDISDKQSPNYPSCIDECLSFIEVIINKLLGFNKKLPEALTELTKVNNLSSNYLSSMKKIYDFANELGARHPNPNTQNITFNDAKYFLISCSAFANYLIIKTSTLKQVQGDKN